MPSSGNVTTTAEPSDDSGNEQPPSEHDPGPVVGDSDTDSEGDEVADPDGSEVVGDAVAVSVLAAVVVVGSGSVVAPQAVEGSSRTASIAPIAGNSLRSSVHN